MTEENIADLISRSIAEMYSKFNQELIEEFKKSLDYVGMPFGELTFDYDTIGITTAIFNGSPVLKFTQPVIEVYEKTKFSYKWVIYSVK